MNIDALLSNRPPKKSCEQSFFPAYVLTEGVLQSKSYKSKSVYCETIHIGMSNSAMSWPDQ